MKDKILYVLSWLICIPLAPYWIIKGIICGVTGTMQGKSKEQIIEEVRIKES